jgi:hypothetical protein
VEAGGPPLPLPAAASWMDTKPEDRTSDDCGWLAQAAARIETTTATAPRTARRPGANRFLDKAKSLSIVS